MMWRMDLHKAGLGRILGLIALLMLVFCQGCSRDPEDTQDVALVTIFAAASTTDAIREVAEAFEQAHEGIRIEMSFASSSTLARQIEQGAPADVYISANPKWMDYLAGLDLIETASRRDLLGNRLALVGPVGTEAVVRLEDGFDLPGSFRGRLALGEPSHVPAGMYAKQSLESLGWWEDLASRLAPAADVRGALRFVETGQTQRGIVYTTDAAASDKVQVVAVFPAESHSPIRYPAAIVKGASTGPVQAFMDFLESPKAAEIFRKLGFEVLQDAN